MNPSEPYFAVIFTSKHTGIDEEEYAIMADRMEKLASEQPGYLGIESARSDDGLGITVSYWKDEASIRNWKTNTEHLFAQQLGKEKWYEHFTLRVAQVHREYRFDK